MFCRITNGVLLPLSSDSSSRLLCHPSSSRGRSGPDDDRRGVCADREDSAMNLK